MFKVTETILALKVSFWGKKQDIETINYCDTLEDALEVANKLSQVNSSACLIEETTLHDEAKRFGYEGEKSPFGFSSETTTMKDTK